jgi:hypothetical protein
MPLSSPTSTARYSRRRCARDWPTWSSVQIARIEGTRPAASGSANNSAARSRSGSASNSLSHLSPVCT